MISPFCPAPSQADNGTPQVLHVQFCMLCTAQGCLADRQVGVKMQPCSSRGILCMDKGLCLSRRRGIFAPFPRALIRVSRSSPRALLYPTHPLIHCALATLGFFPSQEHIKCFPAGTQSSLFLLRAAVFL